MKTIPSPRLRIIALLLLTALSVVGCTGEPVPTAGQLAPTRLQQPPAPSPLAAFTGQSLPATPIPLPTTAPLQTATPVSGGPAPASAQGALTVLYTNDSRGYVDPCG